MHERIIRIRPRTISVCSKVRIKIILSLPHITGSLPLETGLKSAPESVEPGVEGIFQRCSGIQFPGILHPVGIVFSLGEQCGVTVPFRLKMHRRKTGCRRIVFVEMGKVVRIIDIGIELQVCRPRLVNLPCQGCIGTQGIVPYLGILALESIRVILAVHASKVAVNPYFKSEHSGKSVAPYSTQASSGIRLIRGSELLGGIGPLGTQVQHTGVDPHIDTFGKGRLISPRVHGERHVERRTAPLGMNLHHSAAQVPVFRRRHAGDHLNRFDIVH